MRFSILNLVAAIFVAACCVNALLLVNRSRDLQKDTMEKQIESELAKSNLTNRESVATAFAATRADVDVLSKSRQRLLDEFESHVDAKYTLAPSEQHFSIVEVPKFQPSELFFLKTYRIYRPETFNFGLHVSFESRNRMTSDNGNGKFESLKEAVIDFPQGLSELNFKFYPPGESENGCRIAIEINSQEVFSRKYSEQKRWGHSSTNFPFPEQRNYSMTDKLPYLVNFQPSAGTTSIRLQVIKVSDEE